MSLKLEFSIGDATFFLEGECASDLLVTYNLLEPLRRKLGVAAKRNERAYRAKFAPPHAETLAVAEKTLADLIKDPSTPTGEAARAVETILSDLK